jgi:hypothetical protein
MKEILISHRPEISHIILAIVIIILVLLIGLLLFNQWGGWSQISNLNLEDGPLIIKIYTDDEGIVEISQRELQKFGGDLNTINEKDISLYHRGLKQPIWIEKGAGVENVYFYAQPLDSIYSPENVYLLVLGGDPPEWLLSSIQPEEILDEAMLEVNSKLDLAPLSSNAYYSDVKLEENKLYKPQVDGGEHWFWVTMTAPAEQEIEFQANHIVAGDAGLYITLWGETTSPQSPDHHIVLSINGQKVLDELWDGKGNITLESVFSSAILINGTNIITIEMPGDIEADVDVVNIDKMTLRYPRKLIVDEEQVSFIGDGDSQEIGGRTTPINVFDVSTEKIRNEMDAFENSKIEINDQVGHHYWVVPGLESYLQPTRITKMTLEPNLRDIDKGADYLALGPKDLLTPLDPLLSLREEDGLQTIAVPLDAVYDQFGFGYPEPEGIRAFLRFTKENWQPSPQYLLLVGDASYDPRGYISSPEANRLPVFFIDTEYGGQTGSDIGYAQLNGEKWDQDNDQDFSFDLAVGRIPAQSPKQVMVIVDKIMTYEKMASSGDLLSSWQQSVLAVADGQSQIFKNDANEFLSMFPDTFQKKLISPQAGEQNVNQKILDEFQEGDLLVAYFGHGSVSMWGKDRLFSVEDVSKMNTADHLPVVLNMTCLTGLFTHPKVQSLAESMLWEPDGGAVVVLAPTSLTVSNDQTFLLRSFISILLENPELPLGEVLRQARENMPVDTIGMFDVTRTFLLFGDPALRLPLTEE